MIDKIGQYISDKFLSFPLDASLFGYKADVLNGWVHLLMVVLFVFWGNLPEHSRNNFKQTFDMQKQFKKEDHLIVLNNDKLLFEFLEQNNINYLNLSKLAWDLVGYKSLTDEGEKLRDVLIWRNDNHPNFEGNKFISEKIYNKLLDDNIIDIEAN